MKSNINDDLVFVGYTNGDQIMYASESEGCFYSDTDGEHYIPLYMLKTHLHRIESTSIAGATADKERKTWRKKLESRQKL